MWSKVISNNIVIDVVYFEPILESKYIKDFNLVVQSREGLRISLG